MGKPSKVPFLPGAKDEISDELNPAAEEAGEEAGKRARSRFSKAFNKIKPGLIAVGHTLLDIGSRYDEMSDKIRVGTGATGDSLNSLLQSARAIGRATPASFSDIGSAVSDLNVRLGLTGSDLETVAAQALEAGRITGEALNMDTLTASFNAFGLSQGDVSGAMDVLFQTSQSTGTSMNDLAQVVLEQAPALRDLGFSFSESAAMAGVLDKAGINASDAMSGMSARLGELALAGESPRETFNRVTREIDELIKSGDIAGAIDLASGIFGTGAASEFIGAVQTGRLSLSDLTGTAGEASGKILDTAKETSSFAEKWETVKNNAALALQPLASGVFDALGGALQAVMPQIQAFGSWLADNQWLLGVVAGLVGITLVGAFLTWAGSIGTTTLFLLGSPITWIVAAILVLIAVIVALVKNWDAVVAWFQGAWGACVSWVTGTFSTIGELAQSVFGAIGEFFQGLWQGIVDFAIGVWNGIRDFFAGLWQGISDKANEVFSAVADFFQGLWQGIVDNVTAVWNGIRDFVVGLWQGICDKANEVFSAVASFFTGLWQGISDKASEVWNAIVSFITGIPQRLLDGLSFLAGLGAKAGEWFMGVLNAGKEKLGELVNFVGGIPGRIIDALGGLGSKLFDSGKALIQGFIDGIKNMIGNITNVVSGIMGKIRDFFPFSPAKTGAFSGHGYTTYSGEALTSDFADSIADGKAKVVGATDELMLSAQANLTGSNSGSTGVGGAEHTQQIVALLGAMLAELQRGQIISVDGRQLGSVLRRHMSSELRQEAIQEARGVAWA
ncbi:MAG: phage tail tape measure protein [Propionibacteriaceae bacterium]|jgi:phage-related minor tail protein|nr:phage tail tape measure protein [Propionibacteriaceae bacterium]